MRLYEELLADGITYDVIHNLPLSTRTTIGRFDITYIHTADLDEYIDITFIDGAQFTILSLNDFEYDCDNCITNIAIYGSLSYQLGMYTERVVVRLTTNTTEPIDTKFAINIDDCDLVHHEIHSPHIYIHGLNSSTNYLLNTPHMSLVGGYFTADCYNPNVVVLWMNTANSASLNEDYVLNSFPNLLMLIGVYIKRSDYKKIPLVISNYPYHLQSHENNMCPYLVDHPFSDDIIAMVNNTNFNNAAKNIVREFNLNDGLIKNAYKK